MSDKELLRECLPHLRCANKGAMMAEEDNAELSTLIARIAAALEDDGPRHCEAHHVQNTNGGTDYWCAKCQAIRLTKCCRDLPPLPKGE